MQRSVIGAALAAATLGALTFGATAQDALTIDPDGQVYIPNLRVGQLTVDGNLIAPVLDTHEIRLSYDGRRGTWPAALLRPWSIKVKGYYTTLPVATFISPDQNEYHFWPNGPGILFNSTQWLSDDTVFSVKSTTKTSDRRAKTDIVPLPSTAAAVDRLNPVTYRLRHPELEEGGDMRRIGFIADEVEAAFPELVFTGADGLRRLHYGQMTAVLTRALQQTRAELAAAQAQIDALALRLAALERAAPATMTLTRSD